MFSVSKRRRLSPNMDKFDVNGDFIVCETLYKKGFSKFNEMRSNHQLCDVKLKAKNGEIIWAHKLILSAQCEYFNIMFNGKFKEASDAEIVVKQFDGPILKLLIDFIYTSKLFIPEENILEILNAICLLQFEEDIQTQCFNYIKTRVTPTNCLPIKEKTECLGVQELYTFCLKYIFTYYRKVIEHDGFLSLSFDHILQIIKSEELCVSEEIVYKSVLMWTAHDLANRTKHFPVLMNYVRLVTISTSYIKSITEEEPFLKLNTECVKYLSKALEVQQENNAIRNLTYSVGIEFRPNYSEYILIINKNPENKRALLFNSISNKWHYLSNKFPCVPKSTGYVLNDGRIMFITCARQVNLTPQIDLNTVFDDQAVIQELGERNMIITTTSPTGKIRDENNVVQIGTKIFVVCNNICKYYDILKDAWFKMNSPDYRTSCSVIAFGGCIYAIGGTVHETITQTNLVEKYNPETDEWTTVSPMKYKRGSVTLCLLDNCIYAIGGATHESAFLKEVEKYDPTTDTWEDVESLKYGRNHAGAASINGNLYVFGGGEKNYMIEKYCPFKKNWTVMELQIPKAFGTITSCNAFTIRREHQHKYLRFTECNSRFDHRSN